MSEEINEKEHPFPNQELNLIIKLNKEKLIPVEDIAIISQLLHKYLNLRTDMFSKL